MSNFVLDTPSSCLSQVKLVKEAPVVGADSEVVPNSGPMICDHHTTAFSSLASVSATILSASSMPVRPARTRPYCDFRSAKRSTRFAFSARIGACGWQFRGRFHKVCSPAACKILLIVCSENALGSTIGVYVVGTNVRNDIKPVWGL